MKLLFLFNITDIDNDIYISMQNYEKLLYCRLNQCKNQIEQYTKNKYWENYKRLCNEYELIFTINHHLPSLSYLNPISRSYFKHWEILHDFEETFRFNDKNNLRVCFLAEGPGGFVEAFDQYRCCPNTDQLFGITLIDESDKTVPKWKFKKENFKILYGVDKTASLYNIDNIDNFIDIIGPNSCDYTTADGGFDFTKSFNNQESLCNRLITSEIYIALRLLKKGGHFVIKTYDITCEETKNLIYLLTLHFEKINIVKPTVSRPANSEKYIICINFKQVDEYISDLRQCIINDNKFLIKRSEEFDFNITDFNIIFVLEQINFINTTLNCIKTKKNGKDFYEKQYQMSLNWCQQYKIPVCWRTKMFYRKYFDSQSKF